MNLTLKNPHSVLAALQNRPKEVLQLFLPSDSASGAAKGPWERVEALAKRHGVPVKKGGGGESARRKKGESSHGSEESLRAGGFSALVKERQGFSVEEVLNRSSDGQGFGLWLALDSLTDPQNVGAIFRTAAFFGVRGILVTQDRSAPLTATAYDVAAGGVDSVPFAFVGNLRQALDLAKERGIWVLGSSEHAHDGVESIQRDRDWLLVLGNEEKGMRRLTEEACDVICRVAPKGTGVTSLNVSVAAGVMISRLS